MKSGLNLLLSFFGLAILGSVVYGAWPVLTHPVMSYALVFVLFILVSLGLALATGVTLNWLSGYWLSYQERKINLDNMAVTVYGKRLLIEAGCAISAISLDSITSHNPFPSSKRLASGEESPQMLLPDEPKPLLMDALNQCDTILYVGGRRRGKTTNMMRVMESRAGLEEAIIFDTHASPSKWPGASKVIGSEVDITEEERFENMWIKMQSLIRLKNKRLDQFRKGLVEEAGFRPRITIYIDEFTHIPKKLKEHGYEIGDFTQEILTEGAKVNFYFVWGVHSFRKRALGLEGSMDLTECFDAVVHLIKERGQFYAQISWTGDQNVEEVKYEPAPPYPQNMITSGEDIFEPKSELITDTEIIDLDQVIEAEPEPEPEPERDETTGWPIITSGTVRQRMEKFADYAVHFGFDVSDLMPAGVLDYLDVNRNGANYKSWASVVESHAYADDDR